MTDGREDAFVAAVAADPRYLDLVQRRSQLAWWLSAVIFFAFAGYLLLIAFDKAALGAPIASGVTSIGIPVGLGLILLAIALTGIYVVHANRRYDAQMDAILNQHRPKAHGA